MKSAFFVEFITIFVKFNIYKYFFDKPYNKEVDYNEKRKTIIN